MRSRPTWPGCPGWAGRPWWRGAARPAPASRRSSGTSCRAGGADLRAGGAAGAAGGGAAGLHGAPGRGAGGGPADRPDRQARPGRPAGPGAWTAEGRTGGPEAGGPPSGPVEETIAAGWRAVLGLPTVDRRVNFFAAGGHSLQLALVQKHLEEQLGRRVPLARLVEFPTVASLAAHLGAAGEARSACRRTVAWRRSAAGWGAAPGRAGRRPRGRANREREERSAAESRSREREAGVVSARNAAQRSPAVANERRAS